MGSIRKIIGVLAALPFTIYIVVILFIYIVGLVSSQNKLLSALHVRTSGDKTMLDKIDALQQELAIKNRIFVANYGNPCYTKKYDPDYAVISRTNTNSWCNIRVYENQSSFYRGFDVYFPATMSAEIRGVHDSVLYVLDKTSPLFSMDSYDASDTPFNSYDTLIPSFESEVGKIIPDTTVTKQTVRITNRSMLSVTTKTAQNRRVEHYIIETGTSPNKIIYKLSFYEPMSESQKNIIINSFTPRLQ